VKVDVPVTLDSGELGTFIGYRVQHDKSRGPMKGGLRYHPTVDMARSTWDEERVNGELHRHMRDAYATLARVAREHRVSLRTAAFIVAIGRVGRATVLRGV
jgi:glutamate dehydrogenase/leucine dehydrogenase